MNHALLCNRGGYAIRRHKELLDIEAEYGGMGAGCHSVEKERKLLPLSGEQTRGNTAEEARLEVSAVGFWRPKERTFLDVTVFDPNCKTAKLKRPQQLCASCMKELKREYNELTNKCCEWNVPR